MNKKITLAILLIFLSINVSAENCGSQTVLNTDCNIVTQLIDASNNPVENANCDANLYKPDSSLAFESNNPLHFDSGLYQIETDANFDTLGIYVFSILCTADSQTYFGTTEYEIVLSIEETISPDNCEIGLTAKRSKKGNFYVFSATGFDSKRNQTGLTPKIEIFDLDSGTKTINQENMTEEPNNAGLYTYYFNGILLPSNYSVKISFDDNCSLTDSFEVEELFLEEAIEKEQKEENANDFIVLGIIAILIFIAIVIIIVARKQIKQRGYSIP